MGVQTSAKSQELCRRRRRDSGSSISTEMTQAIPGASTQAPQSMLRGLQQSKWPRAEQAEDGKENGKPQKDRHIYSQPDNEKTYPD